LSRKKTRPEFRARVHAGMSQRDIAAALGLSTAEMHRYKRLAEVPKEVFERRMAESFAAGIKPSAQSLAAPVPARGRVDRALALMRGMSDSEIEEFMVLLPKVLP